MANIQSIKVPVEVQVNIQNSVKKFDELAKSYEQALKNVDPSSITAKQMNKTLNQVRSYLTNIDVSTLGSDLFSEKDYQQIIGYIKKIDSAFQAMAIHAQGFTAKSLKLDTTGLEDLEEQIKELKKARSEFLKLSTAQIASQQDLNELNTAQAGQKTGFRASATHKQNLKALTDQKAQTESALAKMEEGEAQVIRADAAAALDTAQNEYDAAVKTAKEAERRLNEATAKIKAHEQAQKNAQAAQAFSGIAGTYKGRNKSAVIADYQNVLDAQITRNGNYKTGGKAFLHTVASWLDYSDEELDVLMQQKATDVVTNLKQKLETSMQANLYTFIRQVSSMSRGYNQTEHIQDLKELKQIDLDAVKAKENEVSAETVRNVAQADYDKAWQVYNETKSLLDAVNAQIEILERLQAEFEARTKTDYTDKINDLTQQLAEQEEALKKEGIGLYEKGAVSSREYRAGAQTEYETHRQSVSNDVDIKIAQEAEAKRVKEESETFKQNLQQSIKHWMSAQQIINIVKDGIRQAYQDIKGLDTAMTNIAVVTDMSVGDLWGKINDYMAIAQQYGVTTQGVYEVSQLYYQQGLSTNEVMAATTETLKMARIAGMGYADAADAMTVAIRAFKMEMSDAQHVTDVYSKVAAVTASDTEELAIAMSKTASSAESVGSSFENTTAMLAVMIETTRESAQNLGSALKSIISR